MTPDPGVGACVSCREWTYRPDDERHGETLPGEHPLWNSLGDCAPLDDVTMGCETCTDYWKREEVDR